MNDFLKNKLIQAIDDSRVLIQVFIVIFFFEDFLIISQKTSLLQIAIKLDSISPLPFVLFFVIIAASWVLWYSVHLIIYAFEEIFRIKHRGDQIKRDSFTAFLLMILTITYSGLFITVETIRPVAWSEHPYLFGVICLALLVTVSMSFYIGIWRGTDFANEETK